MTTGDRIDPSNLVHSTIDPSNLVHSVVIYKGSAILAVAKVPLVSNEDTAKAAGEAIESAILAALEQSAS